MKGFCNRVLILDYNSMEPPVKRQKLDEFNNLWYIPLLEVLSDTNISHLLHYRVGGNSFKKYIKSLSVSMLKGLYRLVVGQ